MMQHVFGPVVSSRLGRSLGLDLLGGKVCSFDCLYCEVAPTAKLTLERKEHVPTEQLLDELTRWRDAGNTPPDVITLGGSGEPTLHSGLADIIAGCKRIFPGMPVAVLTNSSMLHIPAVREELLQADTVLPSMDSLVESEFQKINQPHRRVSLAEMAESLLTFRQSYPGSLCLEILLCKGINDTAANLAALRAYIGKLQPNRVDVVTLSRPGAYPEAVAVDGETLRQWREALGAASGLALAEPSPKFPTSPVDCGDMTEAVLASLQRRPQTAAQLAQALQTSVKSIEDVLEKLQQSGHITMRGSQTGDPSTHFFSAT